MIGLIEGFLILSLLETISPIMAPSWIQFTLKWCIPVFVGMIMFCNHYVRDCPGALEKPLETELSFTSNDYSILNSLYFFPNIISPLLAGMFIEQLGGIVRCFYLSLIIASAGHISFAIGASLRSKVIMFLGKALSGSMYEIIDAVMPIIYMGPMFKQDFQLVVGLAQIFIRLGSVINFIVSPYVYSHYSLLTAIWVASIVGCGAITLFAASRYIECELLLPETLSSYITSDKTTDIESMSRSQSGSLSGDINVNDDNEGLELVTVTGENTYNIIQTEQERRNWSSMSSSISQSIDETEQSGNRHGMAGITIPNDESADKSSDSLHRPVSPRKTAKRSLLNNNKQHDYVAISLTDESTHVPENHLPSNNHHVSPGPSSTSNMTWFAYFLELTQFHQFSARYYFYVLAGSFLYGSIVPFWFFGSKYLQDSFFYNIETADSIMTLPEGLVVLTGFPFGLIISYLQPSVKIKLVGLGLAQGMMAISFLIVVYAAKKNLDLNSDHEDTNTHITYQRANDIAIFGVVLLGASFSCACGLFWGIVNAVVDEKYLSQGSGIVSCAVNVLPTILPPIISIVSVQSGSHHSIILILTLMAALGSISSFIAVNASSGEVSSS